MIYETEEELLIHARKAEGKTFGEIDQSARLSNGKSKGSLGQIIEESFFGYQVNSEARPDFENLGIELKVTPFKRNKNNTVSAKERLVLNIINYMEEVKTSFNTSSFWKKNQKILLMFYEWMPELNRRDYTIHKSILFTFSQSDLEIIKADWETIITKIRSGKAHELSEGDTVYLGACTKGSNKNTVRNQPYSETPAMQRAYSLKHSYMTALVRKYIKNEELISFVQPEDLKNRTLNELLQDKFGPFIGLTDKKIAGFIDIPYNSKSKSFIPQIISGLLGIKGTRLNQIEEFAKANIQFKTVRLEPNGVPKESMSFEVIDFHQWANETWEESYLRERFIQTKFLFVIFEYKETKKDNPNRELYFKGIKLWHMPVKTIENEIKQLWEEVHRLLKGSLEVNYVSRGKQIVEKNNFPKSNFNGVTHIRPKATDGQDKVLLPTGQRITKQCYWLNNTYIAKIIN
ncbi:restriction endonuclease [Cytobacillus spongiae]|uniref:Sau3AI family type II restriction endonuclease n=1 Tax=Cytobacillus spongiae TaxID=2901381 RepID=UPI001F1C4224|nr:Sau3AI family type II restriction endonuclease [Cytobacillus spongiae]UII57619.1 restriction endonuclease [Cytobacillus spongiae]